MAMSLRTLIIKVLVFMHQASSLSWDLADTQQLNIPYENYTIVLKRILGNIKITYFYIAK